MPYIWLSCCFILLLSYNSTAAPTAVQVRLLSYSTGLYVQVTGDGEVNASGSRSGATVFYVLYKSSGFQLQLKNALDEFVVVASLFNATTFNDTEFEPGNYALRVERLSSPNFSLWTISEDDGGSGCGSIKLLHPDPTANCYLAFDSDTYETVGPCGLRPQDDMEKICIERVKSS